MGNLSKLIYPDNTAVTYAYDANRNLIRVTDWANRVTSYTYDVNNRVVGVTKPDGSVTTTVYDNKQRVTSTVERTAGGVVITGFEYTYDDLSRIVEEKHLADNTKMCYTYDSLSRVTARTIKKLSDNAVISTETFTYDAAGNITDAPDSCFQYDTNNRLISFNGNTVNYDLDGNMLNNGVQSFTYDSANRLVTAGGHTYTYNAEDVRIRNLCENEDTTYTYDTNCKLSQLLTKTTNGTTTKYVYGKGLIGEEVGNTFKTYHFDCRGSTVAITDATGNITDTFAYDTYGKLISRTGTSEVIFCYNGRDGVVTDANGLIYMRARYYSPEMKRFINADIIAGEISNAITLNRFAYANGNPVSLIDPFGLAAQNKDGSSKTIDREEYIKAYMSNTDNALYQLLQTWGFSLTKSVDAAESTYIDVLWGGFVVKLYVDISFATPLDTDATIDVNVDSGDTNYEVTTPELKIPWTDIGTKVGAYVDGSRLSVGTSAYVSNDGWTFGSKHQIGLYSEANITTISYEPDDKYLPTVSISLDSEVNHLVKVAIAAIAVAAVYAPGAIVAAAPTAAEFIQQLGTMAPAFAH